MTGLESSKNGERPTHKLEDKACKENQLYQELVTKAVIGQSVKVVLKGDLEKTQKNHSRLVLTLKSRIGLVYLHRRMSLLIREKIPEKVVSLCFKR